MTHVLIHGNPIDGLSLVGPFDNAELANEQGGLSRFDYWWVAQVESPGEEYYASEEGLAFLLHGNPVDGLSVVGPFYAAEVAAEYAIAKNFLDWWGVDAQLPAPTSLHPRSYRKSNDHVQCKSPSGS